MLYTRKGDGGTSGLFGTEERFPKDSPIFEALGTADELNSWLGLCYAKTKDIKDETVPFSYIVRRVQEDLFILQAELAGASKTITEPRVQWLEGTIASIEEKIKNPHAFVIPGETEIAALFDYARTVSRRAERAVIAAHDIKPVSQDSAKYLNRLSSLLYAVARYGAQKDGHQEQNPSYQ